MIARSFIQQLVSQCDIEDVISSYVNLKKTGRTSKAVCPFHSEKTPSFVVHPESQSYYCFGCGAGGDTISFVMSAENLDYVEAVRLLATRVGMQLPDDGDDRQSQQKAAVLEVNREAARFFNSCLRQPIGRAGYEYFKGRELSDKTITAFGLGYAPDSWDSLLNYLRQKGFSDEDMLLAAVVSKGKSGHIYDQFRNRVMFPIIDLRQNVIGFGGRVLDDSKPKYLNSPDTLAFKKSRNLFALNFAKNAIGEARNRLILAEGYMDVIAINAAGFINTVATLGTSLTEEQARLMAKYAKEVVIAYDSDGAGQTATLRAINLLSDAGVQTKVLHMDGAKDPDEYIKRFGAKRFEMLVDSASDVIEHELARLKEKNDMETAEGKIAFLKQAINVLSELKNPLEREVYGSAVARESGASAETIKTQTEALLKKKLASYEKKAWREIEKNKGVTRDKINPQKGQNIREAISEERILAFLYKNGDYCDFVYQRLPPADFVTDFNRRVYEAILLLHSEGTEINLSTLSPQFSHEEIGGISAILAKNSEEPNTNEALASYIDILLEYKDKINPAKAKEFDPADIEEYRQRLMKKKK